MFISDEQTRTLRNQLPEYLVLTNRSTNKPFCCANPNHPDSHPSMRFDPTRDKVHCFSCGCTYDLFDLIRIDYDIQNFNDAKIKAAEILGCNHSETSETPFVFNEHLKCSSTCYDFTDVIEGAHIDLLNNEMAKKHFTKRGLSDEIIHKYKLGFSRNGYNALVKNNPELQTKAYKQVYYNYVLPFLNENRDCNYFMTEISDRRLIDDYNDKYRKINKLSVPIFNEHYLSGGSFDVIIITEGIYDALSIEDIGYNSIALSGTSYKRLSQLVKKYQPKSSFIIMCDNDSAGKKANITLYNELHNLGYACSVANLDLYKDPNEHFCTDKKGLITYLSTLVHSIHN